MRIGPARRPSQSSERVHASSERPYRGDGRSPEGHLPTDGPRYVPDAMLRKAVNVAIYLGRPLLLKGPPGSGKTRVAYAVAHELGLPLHAWYVKSTSRARDGLYTFDMVRRLHDAHLDQTRAQRLTPYIHFGPLGEAIRSDVQSVVLIDEIDKADIDFPNDLLREIEEKRFTVDELVGTPLTVDEQAAGFASTYVARAQPLIVITSNDERELPEAFLRRCVFHYLHFPQGERLVEIVRANTLDLAQDDALVRRAIGVLARLRQLPGVRKQPETSELIDWVRVLHALGTDLSALDGELPPFEGLPHWEVLYKHQSDVDRVRAEHERVDAR